MAYKKEEQIAIDAYQAHNNKFNSLKDVWEGLMRRYENELRGDSISAETQSKVRLGQAFSLVENFVSRVISQVPRFHYLPREKNDVDFVEQYAEFNEYQHDQANSKEAFEMIAKWAGICGLSGWKMGWRTEEILHKKKGKEAFGKVITNPALVEVMDKVKVGKTIKVDDNETISSWTIDPIKPFDLIWSIDATEREDCRVLGHKIHGKTVKELKMEGYNTERLIRRMKNQEDYWQEKLSHHSGDTHGKIIDDALVTIAELYVKILKNGVWEFSVVTLGDVADGDYAGQPVPIRTEKNPFDKQFTPIGLFRPIKRPGKMEGFGIIEPVLGILDAEEDTLNMVTEAFWTDVSRPLEYVPNNIIDEDALEFKPRTLVPVRKLGESVNVMNTPKPDFGGTSYVLGFLEKTKQNVSAITDYQTGANQKQSSQTATEIKTKTFLSEQRSNKVLQRFEMEVLEPAAKMALWLNKQFLQDQKKIIYRVLGKKGKMMENKITLKAIEAIKDTVIVSGSSAYIDRNDEMQKWQGLYQMAMNEVQLGPEIGIPIDREKIMENILEKGFGVKDPENYIPSLKEREAEDIKEKMKDLKQAKKENHDPASARVMPDDNHKEVHLPIHTTALQNGGMTSDEGVFTEYTPEQKQMMTEHINEHTRLAGGSVPGFAQAAEQQVGNQITQQQNGQPTTQGAPGAGPGGGPQGGSPQPGGPQ